MNQRTKSFFLFGVLCVSVAIVAAFTATREPFASPTPVREGGAVYDVSSLHPTAASTDTTPSKENVSAGYRHEVEALQHRVSQDPTDTLAIGRLARLLEASHQSEQAARYYRHYLTINRASKDAWLGLANAYAALRNWDAAEESMAALLELAPGDPEAMYNLGAIHANRGDYSAARMWWRKVREQPHNPTLADKAAASLERIDSSRS